MGMKLKRDYKIESAPIKSSVNQIVGILHGLIYIQTCRLEGYKELQERFKTSSEYNNLFSEARSLSYICREYLRKLITIYGHESSNERILYGLFSLSAVEINTDRSGGNYEIIFERFGQGELDVQNAYAKALGITSIPPFMSEILILQKYKLREQYYRIRKLSRPVSDKRNPVSKHLPMGISPDLFPGLTV